MARRNRERMRETTVMKIAKPDRPAVMRDTVINKGTEIWEELRLTGTYFVTCLKGCNAGETSHCKE